jgi:hypothetical protein
MIQEIIVVIDDTLHCIEKVIIDILLCLLVFSLFLLIKNLLIGKTYGGDLWGDLWGDRTQRGIRKGY